MHHVVSSLEQDKISLIHRCILDWKLKCIHEAGIYCTTAVHPTTIHLVTSCVPSHLREMLGIQSELYMISAFREHTIYEIHNIRYAHSTNMK